MSDLSWDEIEVERTIEEHYCPWLRPKRRDEEDEELLEIERREEGYGMDRRSLLEYGGRDSCPNRSGGDDKT